MLTIDTITFDGLGVIGTTTIWTGFFHAGVDEMENGFGSLPPGLVFNDATLTLIPEPSAAALLGLGPWWSA